MTHKTEGTWKGVRFKEFTEWLDDNLEVTWLYHEYEADMLVYSYGGETCRVQEVITGFIRWYGKSLDHYNAFRGLPTSRQVTTQKVGKNSFKNQLRKGKKKLRGGTVQDLLRRDGDLCFFCGKPILRGRETLEHLLPQSTAKDLTVGEALVLNDAKNLALAHETCNSKAGNLSIVEKVKLREQLHEHHRHDAGREQQHQGCGF